MIRQLLDERGVTYVAGGMHSHNTPGWVNVHCPFCRGTPNYHLGIHEDGRGAHCWRCGPHSAVTALSIICGMTEREVRQRLRQRKGVRIHKISGGDEPRVEVRAFKYPRPYSRLNGMAKKYLEGRGYDPDRLESEWGLLQTGPTSFLDNISYSHRIIIPFFWDGKVVSFQARDITGQSNVKYLACTKGRERVHHKHIVYGKQKHTDVKIVVEGPPDVWRLGEHAIATMGIKFTTEQVLNMSKLADRFVILFDAEQQAQQQARMLAAKLRALGKPTVIEKLRKGDPGDLKQDDADHLVNQLIKGSQWK